MKVGAEDKRKQMIAGALGLTALGLAGYTLFGNGGSSAPPRPAAPVVVTAPAAKATGPGAVKALATSAALDPTLHMDSMLVTEGLVYTGSGRNIFLAGSEPPPVPIPVPLTTARNAAPPPAPEGPKGPPPAPPLPPIPLKYFGTALAENGTRRAFLLNGDDVFVALVGDVVERRYRVVSIAANSVLVEDIPNNNKQTLPLVGN